ncbi:hypothetical protein SRHO_G00317380 [Serrasalmus rhombeus]
MTSKCQAATLHTKKPAQKRISVPALLSLTTTVSLVSLPRIGSPSAFCCTSPADASWHPNGYRSESLGISTSYRRTRTVILHPVRTAPTDAHTAELQPAPYGRSRLGLSRCLLLECSDLQCWNRSIAAPLHK